MAPYLLVTLARVCLRKKVYALDQGVSAVSTLDGPHCLLAATLAPPRQADVEKRQLAPWGIGALDVSQHDAYTLDAPANGRSVRPEPLDVFGKSYFSGVAV